MRRKLLVLALLISACGQADQRHFDIVGFEFYYQSWLSIGGPTTDNLVIKFGTITVKSTIPGGIVLAQCADENSTPTITINKAYWDAAPQCDRAELILHEMGHCVLNRGHRDDILPDGRPASIMNTMHFNPKIIYDNADYYREELFGRIK